MSEYIYGTDDHEGHWLTGEEIVRCRDCANASIDQFGGAWCNETHHEIRPSDYCAWPEPRNYRKCRKYCDDQN